MENKTYGYVRVSTQEQNEMRQLKAMRDFGVREADIIVEKLSGRDFKRPPIPEPGKGSAAGGRAGHQKH